MGNAHTRQKQAGLKVFTLMVLAFTSLSIYLFVTAPPPLPDREAAERKIPVAVLFTLVAAEQDAARTLYTREIVGKGLKAGFAFDENWRDEGIDAGPLPALFLRETAAGLETRPERLSLFLGSSFPIRAARPMPSRACSAPWNPPCSSLKT